MSREHQMMKNNTSHDNGRRGGIGDLLVDFPQNRNISSTTTSSGNNIPMSWASSIPTPTPTREEVGQTKPSSSEEALCNELLHYGCLDGSWSIEALQYHFGLKDQQLEKLISYGKKANCICVVSRVACPTDDNGIP